MGLTKRRLEEEQEGQYSTPPDRYVCHRCVTDSFLKDALQSSADTDLLCSYCNSEGAAGIDVLLREIRDAITADFTAPANELPHESQSGGYLGNTYSGEDVLEELSHWTYNECLYSDVQEAFSDSQWCEKNYLSLNLFERYWLGWKEFKEVVKHHRRLSHPLILPLK